MTNSYPVGVNRLCLRKQRAYGLRAKACASRPSLEPVPRLGPTRACKLWDYGPYEPSSRMLLSTS